MQAGARAYPEPPLPKQHETKPGGESELQLKPMCDAEELNGKVALITGADSGIGRAVEWGTVVGRRSNRWTVKCSEQVQDLPRRGLRWSQLASKGLAYPGANGPVVETVRKIIVIIASQIP
jgi:hypothetical protein